MQIFPWGVGVFSPLAESFSKNNTCFCEICSGQAETLEGVRSQAISVRLRSQAISVRPRTSDIYVFLHTFSFVLDVF